MTITSPEFYEIVRDELENEIDQLEQRLSRLRLRLSQLERTERRVTRAREARNRARAEREREQQEEINARGRFHIGDSISVINRYDELYQEVGEVTRISRQGHFVYFILGNGNTRYRAPHNIQLVEMVEDSQQQ